jgi:eukaryotic translation initiation factor 2C
MNVKLGGVNSYLGDQLKFVTERPTMIFGADVTHPPPGGDPNRSSIVSCVGSMDAQCARFAAALRTQQAKLEIIQDIKNMVKELLIAFHKATGTKPERVLFYRDGISEGQFNEALRVEIRDICAAFEELEPGYHPSLTYVVVQKRHHAKFFPRNREDADRSGNILPGTVVDTTVTHPCNFDFYLCSHAGLQGTSKPSHYYVIYDENNFNSEGLQSLTYNLCYLYCRATCSVSIPPPVYYAHLAASRARCYLNGWDDSISDNSTVHSFDINSNYSLAPVIPNLRKFMYYM